mgnify:FL=1
MEMEREEVIRIWEQTEKDLALMYSDPYDYLKGAGYAVDTFDPDPGLDDEEIEEEKDQYLFELREKVVDSFFESVLEIIREQSLNDGEWNTFRYVFTIGTGGPHIEFTTDYEIRVYWASEKVESVTWNADSRKMIDMIEDRLSEVY